MEHQENTSNQKVAEKPMTMENEDDLTFHGLPLKYAGIELSCETAEYVTSAQHLTSVQETVSTMFEEAKDSERMTPAQTLYWHDVLVKIAVSERWTLARVRLEVERCMKMVRDAPFVPRSPKKLPEYKRIVLKSQEEYLAEKLIEAKKIVEEKQKREHAKMVARRTEEMNRLRKKRYTIAEYKKMREDQKKAEDAGITYENPLKIRTGNENNKMPFGNKRHLQDPIDMKLNNSANACEKKGRFEQIDE